MIKGVREGHEVSNWTNPNAIYEAALQRFVRGVLDGSRANPVLVDFPAFVGSLARPGAITSPAQLVLKLAVPGIPDIYQGGELWDFNLIDPDNHCTVDWERSRTLLSKTGAAGFAGLGSDWRDGREKYSSRTASSSCGGIILSCSLRATISCSTRLADNMAIIFVPLPAATAKQCS
jgi:(1->4)-alpha-D-glucan 1-alpha-D-glucosylmutase